MYLYLNFIFFFILVITPVSDKMIITSSNLKKINSKKKHCMCFLPFWNKFEKIQVFKYHIKCVLVNSTVSDEMIITSSNLQILQS
jgi:hypothetical protein